MIIQYPYLNPIMTIFYDTILDVYYVIGENLFSTLFFIDTKGAKNVDLEFSVT